MLGNRRVGVKLAALSIGLSVALAIWGYYIASQYLSSLVANFATTLLGLGGGLWAVNVYLDHQSRRDAVSSLLRLIAPSIRQHHNSLLNRAWNLFGKPQWTEILDRYASNEGDPRALTPEERTKVYDMVESAFGEYIATFAKLETELKELSAVMGWSFDPIVLGAAFNCRYAITRLRQVAFDGSDRAKNEVCEQFLDAGISSSTIILRLVAMTGSEVSLRETFPEYPPP